MGRGTIIGGKLRIVKEGSFEMGESDRDRGEPAYMTEDTIELTIGELDGILSVICHEFAQQTLCNKLNINSALAWRIKEELYQYLREIIKLRGEG
jgi:hypothetical protein